MSNRRKNSFLIFAADRTTDIVRFPKEPNAAFDRAPHPEMREHHAQQGEFKVYATRLEASALTITHKASDILFANVRYEPLTEYATSVSA